MKCNILSQQHTETWSTEEAGRSLGNSQADLEGTFYTHVKQESGSSTSSDSGYEGECGQIWGSFLLYSPHTPVKPCPSGVTWWSPPFLPLGLELVIMYHSVVKSTCFFLGSILLFPFLCLVTQHSSSLHWLPSPHCPLSFILVTRSPWCTGYPQMLGIHR